MNRAQALRLAFPSELWSWAAVDGRSPEEKKMNQDKIDGAGKQIKGSIKEAAGKLTGNTETQAEGKAEKIVGKVQSNIGKAEDNVKHELNKR
jgi:uncharacterized protein YjbJ (UPF0337 family)